MSEPTGFPPVHATPEGNQISRPYVRPKLTVLGSFKSLTQAASGTVGDAGTMNMLPM